MSLNHHAQIVTNSLILYLDPANKKFYNGSTSSLTSYIYSPVGGVGTLQNGPFAYNTSSYGVGVLEINNVVNLVTATSTATISVSTQDLNSLASTENFTVMFAAKKNYYGVAGNNVGNSELFQGVSNGYNTGWRINENSQGTQGAAFNIAHSWGFDLPGILVGISINDVASTNRMCIVAFSISPTQLLAYCNGATNTKANPLNYVSGTSNPYISFTSAGEGSFNGQLGFFMIYNRALTLDEINQNFDALRGRYGL